MQLNKVYWSEVGRWNFTPNAISVWKLNLGREWICIITCKKYMFLLSNQNYFCNKMQSKSVYAKIKPIECLQPSYTTQNPLHFGWLDYR